MKFSMKPWNSNNPWIFYGSAIGTGIVVAALGIFAVGIPPVKGTSTPTEEIISPEPAPLVPEFMPMAPLPDLLDLQPVVEEVLRDVRIGSCLGFELLDDRMRHVVLRDALNGGGNSLVGFNMCVKDHAAFAGELVDTQCRNGTLPTRALDLALGYLKRNCSMRVDPYEDQGEEPFDLIKELF